MTTGHSPNSAEVIARIRQLRARYPEWVTVRRVATSEEGRPIHTVTVTDPRAPAQEKQHVLVAGGHHGNEDSGRLIALALLDWLVSDAGAETRRRQKIVVLPNQSPDAAERDIYFVEGEVNPLLDHGEGGPKTPQGVALEEVARALAPEVYVDLHSRGYAGFSYDMVLWAEPRPYLEDDNLLHAMAAEMGAAGERGGVPHLVHPLSWPGFLRQGPDVSSACAYAYREFKSLAFLTETSEHNDYALPARVRARIGLARLRALLAWGERRHPKLYCAGYPCYLVGGMFALGLVAVGATAAARRKSRISIWRNRPHFDEYHARGPEERDRKVLRVGYSGEPLTQGIGFQVAVQGEREVAGVSVNGRRLRPAESNGHYAWRCGGMTFVVVALHMLRPGEHEIVIALR
jgi:hypothetical protein